ncbi:dihydroneopterin aldolase [Hydrogenimonas urashimensis]|uniref:dihydroneopterin aldolase n=1 Tax=Hydrogenimonas urashimensis TaxID=2740515 RepID=UPI0019163EA6|nr:dihydroneopterin aldolase [Hydrogenimonas urashimensis]
MRIRIESLSFEAVLGILAHERTTPQRILVDATIDYSYTPESFIDYAKVAKHIEKVMQEGAFHLIEEALETLFSTLKKNFPKIETIKITICKPDILPNCRVCVEDFRSFL